MPHTIDENGNYMYESREGRLDGPTIIGYSRRRFVNRDSEVSPIQLTWSPPRSEIYYDSEFTVTIDWSGNVEIDNKTKYETVIYEA